MTLGFGGESGRVERQPPMRAGADSRIVAHAPVDQVVPRFVAGAGVIRNLIGGQPGRGA